MADVFISYARDERDRADQIKDALEGLGLSVFLDVEGLDGGDVFSDVLDKQVKTSGAVLGLWSPHALSRPWVRIECQIARDRGVLVPALIAPIDAIKDVPAMFYGIQHIDLSNFDGDVTDQNWLKLVKALARTLERPDLLTRAAGELKGGISGGGQANEDLRKELAQLRAEMNSIRTQADAIPMKQTQTSKAPSLLAPLLIGGVAIAVMAGFWIGDPLHLRAPKEPAPVVAHETLQEQLASGKIALGKPTPLSEIQGAAPLSDEAQRVLDQAAELSATSDVNLSPVTLATFRKACDGGSGEDCYQAARQLEIGLGVDRDEAAAAKLYDAACRLDVAKACSSAGAMLIRSADDAVSVTKADAYYRQACKLGEKASCKP